MIPYASPFPICTTPQVMETYSSREPTDCFCSSYTCRSLSVPFGTSGGYPVIPYSVRLSYWSWSGNILQSWTHRLFPFPKYLSWFVGPVFVLLSFRFCRSFTPLLTLPLRRTLTYPPFYRWLFCLLTVPFFSVCTCGTLLDVDSPGAVPARGWGSEKHTPKNGIFRRSRACHDCLLQPALSPRNSVVGVQIEGLAQPVALHNRLSRPVGHLRILAWRNPMAPARLVDPDVERKTKCLPSACQSPETFFVPSLPQETTAPWELPSALLGQWGGRGGVGVPKKINSTLYIPDLWYRCSHVDELQSCEMMMEMKLMWCWWKWSWCDVDAMMLDGLLFDAVDVTVNTCNLKSWKEIKSILLFK